MSTEQAKTELDATKHKAAAAFDQNVKEPLQNVGENIKYAANQASDKANEMYYAGKQ